MRVEGRIEFSRATDFDEQAGTPQQMAGESRIEERVDGMRISSLI